MRFKTYLTEIFDNPAHWVKMSSGEYSFEVDNQVYQVYFDPADYAVVGVIHTLEYGHHMYGNQRQQHTVPKDRLARHTLKVIATVAAVVLSYLKTDVAPGERIAFESAEDLDGSQHKLYTAMAKKLSGYPGVVVKSHSDGGFDVIKVGSVHESLDSPPAHYTERVERDDNMIFAVVYQFEIGTHSTIRVTFRQVGAGEWEMALSRNGAHGIDGDLKGQIASTTALRMYSTVVKVAEEFTRKYMNKSETLTIGSWEGPMSSQASLYYRMLKKLGSRFPNLRIKSVPGDQHYIRKINESWDSPVPYEMKQFLRDEVRFKFKIDDTFYVAAIAQLKKSDGVSSRYSLEFGIARDQSSPMSSWAYSFPKEVDRDIKHTNHVYSTFLKGVYEYFDKIKLGKNDDIVFSAYNEYSSQSRLYHALSRRIAKHLGLIVAQSGNANWLKHPDHPKLKILSTKPPVNEMFASPLPWTTMRYPGVLGFKQTYKFTAGSDPYVVEIYKLTHKDKPSVYEIAYYIERQRQTSKSTFPDYSGESADSQNTYHVLSTVNAAVEDFFAHVSPLQAGEQIRFAAHDDEGGQIKLYNRVADRLVSRYKMRRLSTMRDDLFHLEKT